MDADDLWVARFELDATERKHPHAGSVVFDGGISQHNHA